MLAVTEAPIAPQKTAKRVNKPDQTVYDRVRLPPLSLSNWHLSTDSCWFQCQDCRPAIQTRKSRLLLVICLTCSQKAVEAKKTSSDKEEISVKKNELHHKLTDLISQRNEHGKKREAIVAKMNATKDLIKKKVLL